ncbi:MAG: hypothetical protein HFF29_02450 [Oscillospiraceae bacterium]|nr:hypothetical protein [Oscillospiraceae bacterium]
MAETSHSFVHVLLFYHVFPGLKRRSWKFKKLTDRRSIQIREPELPPARRKSAGILCVFQDLSTRPAAILAAKLGAEAIGTASKKAARLSPRRPAGHMQQFLVS